MDPSLADRVLPLIRTRAPLTDWAEACTHAEQMHLAIDELEKCLGTGDAEAEYDVCTRALEAALKVQARSNDPGLWMRAACQRLIALHPRTALAAAVPPSRLLAWMLRCQCERPDPDLLLDPVAYAPALGLEHLERYRQQVDRFGMEFAGTEAVGDPEDQRRRCFEAIYRRLAVLSGDRRAVVRTHRGDTDRARWLLATARGLAEMGDVDGALGYAHRAAHAEPDHEARDAAEYWCELLAEHHPEQLLAARRMVFDRWRTCAAATALREVAGDHWPEVRGQVLDSLRPSLREVLIFLIDIECDVGAAWDIAFEDGLDHDEAWYELALARAETHPDEAAAMLVRIASRQLHLSQGRDYLQAARLLEQARELATDRGRVGVDRVIMRLRHTHRHRARLQVEFDYRRLPRPARHCSNNERERAPLSA